MKKTIIQYFQVLWVLGLFLFFTSCNTKAPKPVFDLNSPGGEVIALHSDSTPKIVHYYKVDKNGNTTREKIGEAYYYENKQEYVGGGLKDGQRNGKWYAFFRDGSVQTEAYYIDGKEHGDYNVYRENGKPLFKGHYNNGICDGVWYWFNVDGVQTRRIKADNNTIACEYCQKCLSLKQK